VNPWTYIPGFVKDPDAAFKALSNELGWERRDSTPREEYYCNDLSLDYTYGSGAGRRTYRAKPYHERILAIRSSLEVLTGSTFETCFLNRYLDQSDHLGWHADDSPEMDDDRPIGIISLGVEREIWFMPKGEKDKVEKLKLGHGSLCLMTPGMQDTHFHRIPKASFNCGERISVTYRGYANNT
jgi:alkylated DNA repair dioxygenase AlkB